jgi:Ser/Thr protein kinase RdoA (MazF antagonist)
MGMSETVYVKHYPDQARAAAARAHHQWLESLNSGVRLPRLRGAEHDRLIFEHLDGRQLAPSDLVTVAETLGRLHAAAHVQHLYTARLNQPFPVPGGLLITDFVSPRLKVLDRLSPLDGRAPAALYKDANIRNAVVTPAGVGLVDFDDLTLAPFGYDLAKLFVSAAMTHGRLDERLAERMLDVYNEQTAVCGQAATCDRWQFEIYAEIHGALTAPYLGCNGYRYPWQDVRPWRVVPVVGGC